MYLELDPDVNSVIEFMQRNVPCSKLVGVSSAIQKLAHPLWGHYQGENVRPLSASFDAPISSTLSRPEDAKG
jgi:hypothetical protein